MSFELIHTSAVRGLKPNSRGFTTVAVTEGVPLPWRERLESLSAYEPGSANRTARPVTHAHFRTKVAGNVGSVLTRITPCGLDYSGRPNRLAHHIVIEPTEMTPAGPAWLLGNDDLFRDNWEEEPHPIVRGPAIPAGDATPEICRHWEQVTGDAGWGGMLIDALRANQRQPIYVVYKAGTDVFRLLTETIALLHPLERWGVTFSTYFSQVPPDTLCAWRCVLAGSSPARTAARAPGAAVLDLTSNLGAAPDSQFSKAARTGLAIPPHTEGERAESSKKVVVPIASAQPAVETDFSPPAEIAKPYELAPETRASLGPRVGRGERIPAGAGDNRASLGSHNRAGLARWLAWMGWSLAAMTTTVLAVVFATQIPSHVDSPSPSRQQAAASNEVAVLQHDLERAESKLTEAQSSLAQEQQRATNLQDELTQLQLERDNLATANTQLKTQMTTLRQQIDSLSAQQSKAASTTTPGRHAWRWQTFRSNNPPTGAFRGAVDLEDLKTRTPLSITPSPTIQFMTVFADAGNLPTPNKSNGKRLEAAPSADSIRLNYVTAIPIASPGAERDQRRPIADLLLEFDDQANATIMADQKTGVLRPPDGSVSAGLILIDSTDNWQTFFVGKQPRLLSPQTDGQRCSFDLAPPNRDVISQDRYREWLLPPGWRPNGAAWVCALDPGRIVLRIEKREEKLRAVAELFSEDDQRFINLHMIVQLAKEIQSQSKEQDDVPSWVSNLGKRIEQFAQRELSRAQKQSVIERVTNMEPVVIHDKWGLPLFQLNLEFKSAQAPQDTPSRTRDAFSPSPAPPREGADASK